MTDREKHQTKDGRNYYIEGAFDGEVRAFDDGGQVVGELVFNFHEGDGKMPDCVSFYSADTNEHWQKMGVATACFEYARRHFYEGMSITAPSRNDTAKTNGNYVTRAGYALSESLRRKDWLVPDPTDKPDYSSE